MRLRIAATAALIAATTLGGCASTGGYGRGNTWQNACQRDYERNRAAATAAGALIGAAAGAAVAKDDTTGAVIGAIAGGLIGRQISKKDDPCGYGFGGYPYNPEYGRWDDRAGVWRR